MKAVCCHARRVIKFDWIDFGLALNEPKEPRPAIEKLLHTSTACLLADLLRRRGAPYRKIFCWLRRTRDVLELSDTPGVRHVEMTFPYADYEVDEADRLAIFADWLVDAVSNGAPELGVDDDEIRALKAKLAEEQYTYKRTDKLKHAAGEPRCEITYEHGPDELVITARCKLPDGQTVSRTIRDHPFIRDELVYGGAISRCFVGEGNELMVETDDGLLLQ